MSTISRQVVLDTETTGLDFEKGDRIIEIGCIELANRRRTGREYQTYVNPERTISEQATKIHGIDTDFLIDKPVFADIADTFIDFIRDSELIIHNAPFDLGFINMELKLMTPQLKHIADYCTVCDTLLLARSIYPGQKNTLDALCKRLKVNNEKRQLHGALLDAQLLADVYLAMTGGQEELLLTESESTSTLTNTIDSSTVANDHTMLSSLPVIQPTQEELQAHHKKLEEIAKESGGNCLWEQQKNNKIA